MIHTCIQVKRPTLPLCWRGPNHFIKDPAPGPAERKTARTTMVFTSRQETQSTKLIPKAACWKRQAQTDGRPMNTSEHRKQSFRDRSSRKLSSELLARTYRRSTSTLNGGKEGENPNSKLWVILTMGV